MIDYSGINDDVVDGPLRMEKEKDLLFMFSKSIIYTSYTLSLLEQY